MLLLELEEPDHRSVFNFRKADVCRNVKLALEITQPGIAKLSVCWKMINQLLDLSTWDDVRSSSKTAIRCMSDRPSPLSVKCCSRSCYILQNLSKAKFPGGWSITFQKSRGEIERWVPLLRVEKKHEDANTTFRGREKLILRLTFSVFSASL